MATVDKARYAGDGVAVVVAETRAEARDAVELVQVAYESLPALVDPAQALEDGAPIVHDDFGTNRCYTWALSAGEVDEEFANADITIKERYRQQRLIPNAIEPRGVLVQPFPATGELTMWSATQVPHIARVTLSMMTGVPEAKLRVVAPEVGGGFGSKLNVYAEEALALVLARRLGRPIKWIETRSEGYQATTHGRDQIQEIELAATSEGKIRAVRAKLTVGFGAYLQLVTAGTPLLGAWLYGGAYDVAAYEFECTGVFTTTTPTDAYRGAGRPEATYAIERAVDAPARKLGKDPVEVRRPARATRRRSPRSSPTSSASATTRSRCCTETRPLRRLVWTRTAAAASRSAVWPSIERPSGSSTKRASSPRISSRSAKTSSRT